MQANNIRDAEIIIAHNQEEWNKLLFLLRDPEPNVFWVNCDTSWLKTPLRDAIAKQFPQLNPYNIYVSEHTESLNKIIFWEDKDKIPQHPIIHVFGMEDAVKSADFRGNLNFQRDSLFRQAPGHIIFWADFATGTVLARTAYDFWSWMFSTVDFKTPEELLTARQKGFQDKLILEDTTILLPHKDGSARIHHLEEEWGGFLKSINGKPSTIKQMRDAVTIVRALALEYRDDGKYLLSAELLENLLELNNDLLFFDVFISVFSELCITYRRIGNFDKAKEYGEKALSNAIEKYTKGHIEIATCQSNLALVYIDLRLFSDAEKLLEEALVDYINVFGENDVRVAILQSNLAISCQDLGLIEKSKELFEKALRTLRINGDNYRVAMILSNLASIYFDLGQYKKAIDLLDEGLVIQLRNFGNHHYKTAIIFLNMAHAFLQMNNKNMAKQYADKALDIFRTEMGESHGYTQNAIALLQKIDLNAPQ